MSKKDREKEREEILREFITQPFEKVWAIDFRRESKETLDALSLTLERHSDNEFCEKTLKDIRKYQKWVVDSWNRILEETCEVCRIAWVSYEKDSEEAKNGKWPSKIASSENGPESLHKCENCGRYWHMDMRFSKRISEEDAKKKFPEAFK